jgi:hypothetical protein
MAECTEISLEFFLLATSTHGVYTCMIAGGQEQPIHQCAGVQALRSHMNSAAREACVDEGNDVITPCDLEVRDATIIHHSSTFAYNDRNGKGCL